MKSILDSISNRELAFLIWLFLISLVILFKASVRKIVANLLQILFWSKLTVYFLAVAFYTAGIVYLLWRINLWDISQVKNTVLWFFTAGAASLFHITDKNKKNYLKDTVKDILSITAMLQFLAGIYSFTLAVELVFLPLAFLLVGLMVVAKNKPEHYQVFRILNKLVIFGGLFLIGYTLFKIIFDFQSFANNGTLNDFLIPATLSFLFLPMLYLLSVIVTHDDVFTGIEHSIESRRLRRYARWEVLIHFHINKTDLTRWRRLLFLQPVTTKHDVDKSIEQIKQMKQKEKNSIPVEFEKGWSPYVAMKFLEKDGITTGYYQPTVDENEWLACSKYVEIDDNLPASNISYYVEGNADVATRLMLSLTVYDRKKDGFAVAQFLKAMSTLFEHSFTQPIPQQIEDMVLNGSNRKINFGNRTITVEKKLWENKNGGYHLNFRIEVNY